MMMKRKMPAVLLAGLMLLALAGCNANKATSDSGTAADSRITETVTDFTPETTVETALPADTESKTEATAEKEKAENTATLESGTAAETRKPKAYAESYKAKGFNFEWSDSLEFGWVVGWMGTPRISRDGVDGTIKTLKHHVDLIYKSGTDPANGVTADSVLYRVVQLEIDGGIAYAVIYG